MFTTYRLLYMERHLGIEDVAEATAAVAFGVLLYTVALLISAAVSGGSATAPGAARSSSRARPWSSPWVS